MGVIHRGSPDMGAGVVSPALAVAPGWARLFTHLAIAIMVAATIVMPIAGIVVAVCGVVVLHAGDAATGRGTSAGVARLLLAPLTVPRALVRGLAVTALSLPYAAAVTAVVCLGLATLVAFGVAVRPLIACAWGAGAGVYVLWAGPGIVAPRRYLTRLFCAVATEPRRIAIAGVVLGVVVFVAVVGAFTLAPSFSPMYGLKTSLQQALIRLQEAIASRTSIIGA